MLLNMNVRMVGKIWPQLHVSFLARVRSSGDKAAPCVVTNALLSKCGYAFTEQTSPSVSASVIVRNRDFLKELAVI
jgi:hypothetical protein